jgi:hypothetical protein
MNILLIALFAIGLLCKINSCQANAILMANYYNVIMFFPKELGGNDDIRVIFDVRNVTKGTVNKRIYFYFNLLNILN